MPINDLKLKDGGWRDYADINTDSLWIIPSRDKSAGHSNDYHGNFVPQIPRDFIRRYTRAGDIVLDLFCGSGTTLVECLKLGRRGYAFDIKRELVDEVNERIKVLSEEFGGLSCEAFCKDSASDQMGQVYDNLVSSFGATSRLTFLHPPYWDIIRFSNSDRCLSNCRTFDDFKGAMRLVGSNARMLTEIGGHIVLVIGDTYKNGKYVPMGWECIDILRGLGLELRQTIVKNMTGNERAKGKNKNLWRFRHLRNGTYEFAHEYVGVFRRNA